MEFQGISGGFRDVIRGFIGLTWVLQVVSGQVWGISRAFQEISGVFQEIIHESLKKVRLKLN